MASEDTDLPQPDSPTMATTSPRLTVVGNAVDRVHDATRGVELHVQILHREQRCRRAGRRDVRRHRSPFIELLVQQRFLPAW